MQREQGQLETDAGDDEGKGDQQRPVGADGGDPLGQVGHVEGAGQSVQQADADDEEGRADGAHHQVGIGGGQCSAVTGRPQGDQHVGGERGDLKEHEGVEGVAGDHHAEQPGEAQKVAGIE